MNFFDKSLFMNFIGGNGMARRECPNPSVPPYALLPKVGGTNHSPY